MLTIKKASTNDCLLINNLADQTWGNTYESILSEKQLDYMFQIMYAPENIQKQMTEMGHVYFIVLSDNIPCGYIAIEKVNDDLFNFQKIYLTPAVQGKGAGRFMIEQGFAYVKEVHPASCTIQLYVNRQNKAVEFYKKMGFHIVDSRDHPIGNGYYMNDYIMACNI